MIGRRLLQRFNTVSKPSKYGLGKSFSEHTYLQPPGSGSIKDVTLIPGIFIGPEITG